MSAEGALLIHVSISPAGSEITELPSGRLESASFMKGRGRIERCVESMHPVAGVTGVASGVRSSLSTALRPIRAVQTTLPDGIVEPDESLPWQQLRAVLAELDAEAG